MEEQKTDLVLKLIDGGLSPQEKTEVELALLEDESLRNFYIHQTWLHSQMLATPIEAAPTHLKIKIAKQYSSNIISYHLQRLKSLEISLLFNMAILISIIATIIYLYSVNSAVSLPKLYNFLPMDYIINTALICIAISMLLYVDKLFLLKKTGQRS